MMHFVHEFNQSFLTISEIQDSSTRCLFLIEASPIGRELFFTNQKNGINSSIRDLELADQYEKKNSYTLTSAEADLYRDRRFNLFKNQAQLNADNVEDDPIKAEKSQLVLDKLAKYGKRVVKLSRSKESTTLNNIFAEFDTPDNTTLLEEAGLTLLYTKLKDAQAQYETTDRAKVAEAVLKGEYVKTAVSAANIVYRLEALFSYIDALALDDFPTYESAIKGINEVIDSVMIPARARQSKKKNIEE